MMTAGKFEVWLKNVDKPILPDDSTILEGALVYMKDLEDKANKLQCLEEAGIDNTEAFEQGMIIYYKRYPEKDTWK